MTAPFRILIATIAVLGTLTAIYWKGRVDGGAARLADSVKALEMRGSIDEAVENLDRVERCRYLGGLQHECDKLRGVD